MFKVLVLQTLYTLPDDLTEYQIRDQFSFMRFFEACARRGQGRLGARDLIRGEASADGHRRSLDLKRRRRPQRTAGLPAGAGPSSWFLSSATRTISASTAGTASCAVSRLPMPPRTMADSSVGCSIPTTPRAASGPTPPTARRRTSRCWVRRGLVPQFQRAKPRGKPMPPHIARGNASRVRVWVAVEARVRRPKVPALSDHPLGRPGPRPNQARPRQSGHQRAPVRLGSKCARKEQ